MSAPEIITLGCRLNTYESEVMRDLAGEAGLDDAIIVNTCAVTGEAERQARQTIRRLRRERPRARIIVAGCAAQISPGKFASMAEVDRVLGNDEKMKPESFVFGSDDENAPRVRVADIMTVTETAPHLVTGFENHTRAFVQVQNGCDHRCTFCVIPYGRGNSRSVPMGDIARQLRLLVGEGYREVVLTGVDITSYGGDLPGQPRLGQMVRRVLNSVPGIERLRLSSLDPAEMDDELFDLVANEPRLMPHLHISLQAGDDMILKRMKRRHSRADVTRFCDRLRQARPDIVLGADLIAGFPTETEKMFRNTCNLVDEVDLTFLHVFPYSPRPFTPAERMPQLPAEIRRDRAARLRDSGRARRAAYLASRVAIREEVLVEKIETTPEGTVALGHTAYFAPIEIAGLGPESVGAIRTARVTGVAGRGKETVLQAVAGA
ncbi:MAG: tRNA (N(6)-L-threonylcarbamoyladenosine(37)-C(2))-methylthiotransferase MtaB [Alphaproteobacteria bacterium]